MFGFVLAFTFGYKKGLDPDDTCNRGSRSPYPQSKALPKPWLERLLNFPVDLKLSTFRLQLVCETQYVIKYIFYFST